jgi:hypothetical protein
MKTKAIHQRVDGVAVRIRVEHACADDDGGGWQGDHEAGCDDTAADEPAE